MEAKQTFAHNLKLLRKCLGITQEELAELSGKHRTYIGNLEQGLKSPTVDSIVSIAKAMNIPPSFLLLDDMTPHRVQQLLLECTADGEGTQVCRPKTDAIYLLTRQGCASTLMALTKDSKDEIIAILLSLLLESGQSSPESELLERASLLPYLVPSDSRETGSNAAENVAS